MTPEAQPSRARAGDVAPQRHTLSRFARRGAYQDLKALLLLVLLGLVLVIAIVAAPNDTPITTLMVPLLLGSLLLNPRHLPWFVIYMFVLLMISLANQVRPTGRTYARSASRC